MSLSSFVQRVPFLRFTLPLICGIIPAYQNFLTIHTELLILILSILFVTLFILHFLKSHSPHRVSLFGIFIQLWFLMFGFMLAKTQIEPINQLVLNDSAQNYIIQVDTYPHQKPNSYQCTGKIIAVCNHQSIEATDINVLLYLEKENTVNNIIPGTIIIGCSSFREITPPLNPHAFNYKKYLSRRNIKYQSYMDQNSWEVLKQDRNLSLKHKARRFRKKLLSRLNEFNIGKEQYGIISALTLGEKAYIDNNLKQSYSSAGATHILAVSGLHVGIIYIVIGRVLLFMKRIRYGKTILFLITLSILWSYALVTGLSPSVVRAAIMFTTISTGKLFMRDNNTYNTILISAFLILIVKPLMLFEVGFQFSYLAVLSIVAIHNQLANIWISRFQIVNRMWEITSVSIAAQLGTFPLAIFYFNQFPVFFLLTNLVVIPLTTIILYFAMIFWIGSSINWFGNIFSYLLNHVTGFMNIVVQKIDQLPGSVIPQLFIDQKELVLIYFIIISMAAFLSSTKKQWLQFGLAFTICMLIYSNLNNIHAQNQKYICFYHLNGMSAIDFTKGNRSYLWFSDTTCSINDKVYLYSIQPNHLHNKIKKKEILNSESKGIYHCNNWFFFNNITIYRYPKGQLQTKKLKKKIHVNYILISQNSRIDVQSIKDNFNCREVIIDGSNSIYYANQLENKLKAANIGFYNTYKKGAKKIILN